MKTIVFGEEEPKGISKGTPVKGGDCIWCDKEVWVSDIGYLSDEPLKDIEAAPVIKDGKFVHKLCFVDILKTGEQVFIAMSANLKKRGLL